MLVEEARMQWQPLALLAGALALAGYVVFGARPRGAAGELPVSVPGVLEVPAPAPERDPDYPEELRAQSSDPAHFVLRLEAGEGVALEGLRLVLDEVGMSGSRRRHRTPPVRAGSIDDAFVPAGDWQVRLDLPHLRAERLPTCRLPPGRTLDLGTLRVELETIVHRGIVHDAQGRLAAYLPITELPGFGRQPEQCTETRTDVRGTFEIWGELPERSILAVGELEAGPDSAAQIFVLPRWDTDTLLSLELQPQKHVLLEVSGASALLPGYALELAPEDSGLPTAWALGQNGASAWRGVRARCLGLDGDRLRFEAWLCAGRQRVWGGDQLHERYPLVLQVGEENEQRFSLQAR